MRIFAHMKYKRLQNEVLFLTLLSWGATFVLKTACLYFVWNKVVAPRIDCLPLPVLTAVCFELCIELYSKLRIDLAHGSKKELLKLQETIAEED